MYIHIYYYYYYHYCVISYHIVLYYIILYYIILCHVILYSIIILARGEGGGGQPQGSCSTILGTGTFRFSTPRQRKRGSKPNKQPVYIRAT